MPIETVLVTGGAGYIGSELCKGLLRQGRRVVAIDNLSTGRRELAPSHPEMVVAEGDIRDNARVLEVMREHRPRRVFHLAAIHFIPYCNAHPLEAMEVNVNGTRSVLNACREERPDFVLFASTAAVYPIEKSPFSEEHPVGPLDVYGYTKLMGEELARLFHLETGVNTVVARFFNAVGARDTNAHLVPDIAAQIREGGDVLKLGNLDPIRDYVHVDDMAAGILAIERHFHGPLGVYNIGAGRGYSVRDVVAAFEAALGRPLKIEQEAGRVRKVERLELVADVSKLRRETGWAPQVNFQDGIARMVREL